MHRSKRQAPQKLLLPKAGSKQFAAVQFESVKPLHGAQLHVSVVVQLTSLAIEVVLSNKRYSPRQEGVVI